MTGIVNVPAFRVTLDGQDLTDRMRPRLVSLSITQKRGDEADQCDIVLDDSDARLEIPRAGVRLTVAIGWERGAGVDIGLVDMGSYVVEDVDHAGPPDQITIRARAADFTSDIRGRRDGSWNDTTLGAIVSDIAGRNKLQAACAPALAATKIRTQAQSRESDIAFLRRLGRANDAVATIKNGKLLFTAIGAGTSASGKPLPEVKIARRDGDRHAYQVKKPEEAGTVEAPYHDRAAAQRKTEQAGSGGKVRRLSRTYPDKEAAAAAAKAEHGRAKRQVATLDLTLALGRPGVHPEQKATVSGYRPAIDATAWLVSEVGHAIGGEGYATTVKLEAL